MSAEIMQGCKSTPDAPGEDNPPFTCWFCLSRGTVAPAGTTVQAGWSYWGLVIYDGVDTLRVCWPCAQKVKRVVHRGIDQFLKDTR